MLDVEFKGLRAAFRTWGSGPPILLLHAGGGSSALWEKVADPLQRDWLLIAPDLLGCGASDAWPVAGALTHDLQAEYVARVIDESIGHAVHVVGHSYGGATAIRLAVDRPAKVRSLLLIEPILNCLLGETGDALFEASERVNRLFVASVDVGQPEAGWKEFIDSRNGAGTWQRLSDERRQEFLRHSQRTRDAALSNLNNRTSLAECRAIQAPMTVVCGGMTTAPDRRTSEVLRDAVGGAHYEIIEGAGHMSPLTHPLEIARIVREHLGRVSAVSRP